MLVRVRPPRHPLPPPHERLELDGVPVVPLAAVHALPVEAAELGVPLPRAADEPRLVAARPHALLGAPRRVFPDVAQPEALPGLLPGVPRLRAAPALPYRRLVPPLRLAVGLEELALPLLRGVVRAPRRDPVLLLADPNVLALDAAGVFSELPRDAPRAVAAARRALGRGPGGVGPGDRLEVPRALPPQVLVLLPRRGRAVRYRRRGCRRGPLQARGRGSRQSRGSRRAGAVGGRPRRRAEQHRQRRDEVHARDEQDERRDGRPAVPAQPDPQPAEGAAVPLVLAVAVQSGGGRGGRGFRRLGVGRGGEAEGLPRGGLLPFHSC